MAARHPYSDQQGVALVTVMLILALLATLVFYAAEDQDLAIRRVSNLSTAEQGYQVNLSGEQWVTKVLEKDMADDALQAGNELPAIDHRGEIWGNLGPPVEVADTGMTLWMQVDDLQARLNINNLVQGQQLQAPGGSEASQQAQGVSDAVSDAQDGEETAEADEEEGLWLQVFINLLVSLELNPELVTVMIDWVDPDESPIGTTGAEDYYYTGLDIPYRAPNHPVASVSELALIRDMDTDSLGLLYPWLSALPVSDDEFTRVNVNTAPMRILALFAYDQPVDPLILEPLVQARLSAPFEFIDDFVEQFEILVPGGLLPGALEMLSVSSDYYAGHSCAQSGQVKFSMTSLMKKQVQQNNVKVLQRERFFGCPTFTSEDSAAQGDSQ